MDNKYGRLWEGLLAGLNDITLDQPFAAYNPGRDETSQKAWDAYNVYKSAAEVALKDGDITTEQFNYIKGKSGAHNVTNRYINREDFPLLHHFGANALNVFYQAKQSFNGQPWSEAIEDYVEQDVGVEDPTELGKPWEEIENWTKKNLINDTA
tara:strand:+ start:197 stop:655 length:459 start_codon:yes stop_codon:yes gene_type:complete